ncbi:hydrogenase 4 subunit B [Sulfurisphaera javensis]|uniref:Hydrogenase 4 subunit B n=1 Tax=Sulfurisphaera javensis TaxID=2049879 RepID=A0AAT9GU56_9CREN
MNLLIVYLGFIISALISIFNKKLGYTFSAIFSSIFIFYGVSVGNIFGYFYVIAGLVWLFSSIFSIFYDNYGRWLSPLFIISILGMSVAFTSNNYVSFLAGWEIMTIGSYAIIGLNKKIDYPAFTFMGFGELSTVLVLAGFLYAYNVTGNLEFTSLPTALPLIISTFGFMIKMGIFPFLVTEWLPIAHGNSPANASAILSASMTLVAIYGIVKMALLSPILPIFGYIIMSIGGFSVFFGALYAYVSNHVKGLPAFSTIENNGAILTSIGAYMILPNSTLGYFALHTVIVFAFAHSIAKTGIFLISGSVEGEDLDHIQSIRNKLGKIGGILLTSSMSGLLPNIGGVATWSLLQTLFMEAYAFHSFIPIIVGSIVAMGEGFATGAMIKFISFTQIFKGKEGRNVKLFVPFLVSLFVLFSGSLSYVFYPKIFIGGVQSLGVINGLLIFSKLSPTKIFGGISPLYVLFLIGIFSVITLAIFGKPKVRRTEVWNNGVKKVESYTAFAFANNIRMMLTKLLRTKIYLHSLETSADIFWEFMYRLSKKYVDFSRSLARSYMNSDIMWYMIYMIIAFIIVSILVVIL